MKFRKEQPIKVVIIGAGGTGGYIAPHLYRLLRTLGRKVRVSLYLREKAHHSRNKGMSK